MRNVTQIGLRAVHWNWRPAPEIEALPGLTGARVDPDRAAIRIYGGLLRGESGAEHTGWLVPRRKGKQLRTALEIALQLQPKQIVIESWNNFQDGSFIQPNSLDGDVASEALHVVLRQANPPRP